MSFAEAMSVDEFGRLRVRGIHDSSLVALRVDPDRVSVLLRDDKVKLFIEFSRVGEFGIRALRRGAIISTVYAYELGARRPPVAAWEALWAGDVSMTAPGSELEIARATGAFKFLVLIECSYGGELAILCNEISVHSELHPSGLP